MSSSANCAYLSLLCSRMACSVNRSSYCMHECLSLKPYWDVDIFMFKCLKFMSIIFSSTLLSVLSRLMGI